MLSISIKCLLTLRHTWLTIQHRFGNVQVGLNVFDNRPYTTDDTILTLLLFPPSFQFKPKSVLSKYDEEIEGEKKKSFRLSAGGYAAGERERELQAIRETLRSQAQSLDMPALAVASEYYTPQEMVSQPVSRTGIQNLYKLFNTVTMLGGDKSRRPQDSFIFFHMNACCDDCCCEASSFFEMLIGEACRVESWVVFFSSAVFSCHSSIPWLFFPECMAV